jgi:hypothetical protein
MLDFTKGERDGLKRLDNLTRSMCHQGCEVVGFGLSGLADTADRFGFATDCLRLEDARG